MAKLEKITLEELVAAEKAATIVRRNYEDKAAMFRDMPMQYMKEKDIEAMNNATKNVATINAVRINILKEMEKRLLELD